MQLWAQFTEDNFRKKSLTIPELVEQSERFDQFVLVLDKLVRLLQLESEKKLSLLRLIQVISLLLVILTASFVLIKLNRAVLVPFKRISQYCRTSGGERKFFS